MPNEMTYNNFKLCSRHLLLSQSVMSVDVGIEHVEVVDDQEKITAVKFSSLVEIMRYNNF